MLRAAGVTEILWCRGLAVVGRAAATLLPSETENLSSVSVDDEGGLRVAAKGGALLEAAALLCVQGEESRWAGSSGGDRDSWAGLSRRERDELN